jgi:cell division protein FtsW (lipid II flippase)
MSRLIAILLALLLFGLVFVEAATEQNNVSQGIDHHTLILNVVTQVLLGFGLFLYCGFAALHSTQRICSPQERSIWLFATIGLNVLGSCWYYVTIYQSFRKAGQGRLIKFTKRNSADSSS